MMMSNAELAVAVLISTLVFFGGVLELTLWLEAREKKRR